MNWDRIEGQWKQLRGRIEERWGEPTDGHIDQIAGQRHQLVGKVQQHGTSRDGADRQVSDWESKIWP